MVLWCANAARGADTIFPGRAVLEIPGPLPTFRMDRVRHPLKSTSPIWEKNGTQADVVLKKPGWLVFLLVSLLLVVRFGLELWKAPKRAPSALKSCDFLAGAAEALPRSGNNTEPRPKHLRTSSCAKRLIQSVGHRVPCAARKATCAGDLLQCGRLAQSDLRGAMCPEPQ